jgi:hypothetical protein
MTREDIIRMAREAGFADGVVDIVGFEGFANFANLVAAHERERLVQVSPLEFVTAVLEKEHLIGQPLMWAQWPNEEKNT